MDSLLIQRRGTLTEVPEPVKGESTPDTWRGRLRWVREEVGLSTRGLAETLSEQGVEVGHSSVSQYETGGSTPRPEYLIAFSQVTGASPTWILRGKGATFLEESGGFDAGVDHAVSEMAGTLARLVKGREGKVGAEKIRKLVSALEQPRLEESPGVVEEGGSGEGAA